MIQSAVLHELAISGEASKNLTEELKSNNPQVPWKHMAGTRNRVIHVYFHTDLHTVWRLVSTKLPQWQVEVELIIRDLEI
jgi:uncharacterized protein with HEPN domain